MNSRAMSITGLSRQLAAYIRLGVAVVAPLVLCLSGAHALPETRRFEITRNGEPIGTHVIEVNRSGNEFFVSVVTDLTVKVLFVTAYRLQIAANERWANGRLLALNSTSNNNGTRHVVSAAAQRPILSVRSATSKGCPMLMASMARPARASRSAPAQARSC